MTKLLFKPALGLVLLALLGTALPSHSLGFEGFWCETVFDVPESTWIFDLTSADIDDDGDVDLVGVTYEDTGVVIIFYNDGDGELDSSIVLAAGDGSGLWSVRTANLDTLGDYLDIIAGDDLGEAIHIYSFDTSTSSYSKTTVSTPTRCTALDVADFNNDGLPDLIAGSDYSPDEAHDSVWLYLNDGSGGFSDYESFWRSDSVPKADKAWAADIDQDGDMDLVYSGGDQAFGRLGVMENELEDTDTLRLVESGYIESGEPYLDAFDPFELRCLDYDNDDYPDLLYINLFTGRDKMVVIMNEDDGTPFFDTANARIYNVHPGHPDDLYDMDMKDADGDGDPDMVAIGKWKGAFFLEGTGSTSGSIGDIKPLYPDTGLSHGYAVELADLDDDGTMECIVAKQPPSKLFVFTDCDDCKIRLNGDVNLTETRTTADVVYLANYVFSSGPEPYPCVASGDVNCDGSISSSDVIYLNSYISSGGPAPCDTICNLVDDSTWDCGY